MTNVLFVFQSLLVSSDYDQKEQISRNFLRNLGPFSEPILVYWLGVSPQPSTYNVTFLWVDPAGQLTEVSEVHMEDGQVVRINILTH
jgi:protein xylosyltransferase